MADKKREFERGAVKRDTLLSFFASAKVEEGETLDENVLGASSFWPPSALSASRHFTRVRAVSSALSV